MSFKKGLRKKISLIYRLMPTLIVDMADSWRSYGLVHGKTDPIFLHIPKTGGITVSRYVYGKEVMHIRQSAVEKSFFFIKEVRFVAIMRDPIQRFISAANFIRTGGTVDRAVDHYDYYNAIDWDDLESIFGSIEFRQWSDIDPVFRPQSFYLDGVLEKVEIYRISDMKKMLEAEFGLWLKGPLKITNRSTVFFSQRDISTQLLNRLTGFYQIDFDLAKMKGLKFE